MHLDPLLPIIALSTAIILATGLILRALKQNHVIIYLIVGILIGPMGLSIIDDRSIISKLENIGVDLLLFFIGMEVVPAKLIKKWKISIIGTIIQIFGSIGFVLILGFFLKWSLIRIVLIGFVISLSSTAVIIRLLQEKNELNTNLGQSTLGILLAQDIAIIPMMIIISLLGSSSTLNMNDIILQIFGAFFMAAILLLIFKNLNLQLPFHKQIQKDHEMQVFASLLLCFGLAAISAFFKLSTALGAFIAGMLISSFKATDWVQKSLEPFKIVFVALFFKSIGMMIDISFFLKNIGTITLLVLGIFFFNTIINMFIYRIFEKKWSKSFYFGALLSQVGEFSFLLAATGHNEKISTNYGYQITIALISVSLFLSPFFIALARRFSNPAEHTK